MKLFLVCDKHSVNEWIDIHLSMKEFKSHCGQRYGEDGENPCVN